MVYAPRERATTRRCPARLVLAIGGGGSSPGRLAAWAAFAVAVGYAILVRTGKYRDGDEHRFAPSPSAAVADLAEAGEWIFANRI